MTPVDPVTNPEAFPGRYAGVTASGQEGLLFSYGTVEFDLRQGGVPVNLAPGSTATVELPLYATLTKTGATVGIGATIPLWSLDERTGTWMQEGEGAVVASAGSPSGLALRAPVSHLSWWNCDAFDFPPYKPKPKCLVDTNADGILEDLTGTGHCWNAGTGPEQPLVRAGARADFPRRLPRFAAQVMIPAAGGVVLPVPADVDVTFRASAKNGTLVGQKVVHGPGDLEEDVIIVLEPLAIDDAVPVSIPWDQTYRIAVAGEVDQYRFEATAGMPVYVTVSRAPRSNLVGTILIQGPNGFEMGPTAFSANGINGTPAAVAFFAPASGRYRILVDGTANEPNGYRLVLAATGGIPLLVSTSPPAGATGLSTALSAVTATFNQALDPSSVTSENFRLDDIISRGGAYPLATTASAADAVASVMPAAALAPGIPYTATLTTGILSAAGDPLQSSYRWSFTTADVAGGTYRVGRGYRTSFAMGPGGESYVAFASDRVNAVPAGVVVARHVPGEGWTPTLLRPSVEGGIDSDTSVATSADGTAMVVFVQMNGGGASGVWASRHPPAGAWSALEELAAPSSDLRSKSVPPIVRMDAAGNAWAVWRRGNALDARRWTPAAGWGATEVVAEVHTAFFRFDLAVGRMGHTAVAWYDPNTGLASVRRFDPVVGWAAIEPLSESGPVFAAHVGVDDGGNVMALWRQHGVVNWRRYSVDDGAWTAPALLINDGLGSSTVCSYSTQLAVLPAGNALMLGCSGSFVFTARYDAGAGTWSAPDTGFFAGGLTFLALAANPAGDAVAAWSHAASGPPEINRVYWRRHSAAAGAWDATPTPVPQVNFSHTEQLHAAITPSGAAAVQYREAPDGNSRVVMVTRLP
jgi:hypothetical protein